MHLGVNISNALQQLESVKAVVDQSDDPKLKVKYKKLKILSKIFNICFNFWQTFV